MTPPLFAVILRPPKDDNDGVVTGHWPWLVRGGTTTWYCLRMTPPPLFTVILRPPKDLAVQPLGERRFLIIG